MLTVPHRIAIDGDRAVVLVKECNHLTLLWHIEVSDSFCSSASSYDSDREASGRSRKHKKSSRSRKFLGREKEESGKRSVISGKKIMMKLEKSKEDKAAESKRNELLKFLNASYD
uniref:Uncharacterized protein n=1 Tax=Aegilops tauschii TaxID=37682 RepID=R7W8E0_AEGTA